MYKWILLILLLNISFPAVKGQNGLSLAQTDSLEQELSEAFIDTVRIQILSQLSNAYVVNRPLKAKLYLTQAFKHASSINYRQGLIDLSKTKGKFLYTQNKPAEAITWYKKADSLLKLDKRTKESAQCLIEMAKIYSRYGDLDTAWKLLNKSLKTARQYQQKPTLIQIYFLLADVTAQQDSLSQTLAYFAKAAQECTQQKDFQQLGLTHQKTGMFYLNRRQPNQALKAFKKALAVYQKRHYHLGILTQHYYIGLSQQVQQNNLKAIKRFEQVLQLADRLGTKLFVAESYYRLSLLHLADDEEKSLECVKKAYEKSLEYNNHTIARDASKALSLYYNKQTDTKNALLYQKAYQVLNDSLLAQSHRQALAKERFQTQVKIQHRTDMLRTAHKTTLANEQAKSLWLLVLVLTVSIGASGLLVWLFRKNKKTKRRFKELVNQKKEIVGAQNNEISHQQEVISAKEEALKVANQTLKLKEEKIAESEKQTAEHQEYIYDSMVYTSEIQKVLLPNMKKRNRVLTDHFVLFKPREILSGDFYWVKKVKPYVVIVTADCTGHGVPSAVTGMLAISFLNNIVRDHMELSAGEILDQLREKVKQTIRHHNDEAGEESNKGRIEMALAMYDLEKMELQYAGAYNALHIIRPTKALENFQFNAQIRSMQQGEYTLLEVKADKQPVGRFIKEKPFETHRLKLEENDKLYMFTNGYVDQPNYKNRLFNKSQLKTLLLAIHQHPMVEQEQILDSTFEEWKGKKPQIDDLLVMGVSINQAAKIKEKKTAQKKKKLEDTPQTTNDQ
ncbi:SpoIIE family protein phosphatase [uncultured Microscilla sp.]|uniref:SpoIIE family protein phosphatase n=1 Tax=uncultured Microscilla sp. TaxID=432653 RepID=UPI002624ED82|nr:SpoIIE family protein phosphatase [uncultured Microscilla sp.]